MYSYSSICTSGFGMIISMGVDSCVAFVAWLFCCFIFCFLYCLLALMAKSSGDYQVLSFSRVVATEVYVYLSV